METEGKLCLFQLQNQHPEAAGDSAGVGAEVCSWPGSLGAAKSRSRPLLLLQHGFLFCHWQAADAPSGSSDIRKISAQEAAFLRVCVCTQGETPVPMGLGTPGPRFMQHCGAGGGWGESQASANEFWEPGKEAPGPCVNEAKHGQIAMSHCSVLPVCLSPSHPAIPAK